MGGHAARLRPVLGQQPRDEAMRSIPLTISSEASTAWRTIG